MADPRLRAALERRYDGPVPFGASVPADYDRPWGEQLANRKRWSWQEVRRLGHLAATARRAYHASADPRHHRDWQRLRHNLAHALRSWAAYRTWLRDHAEVADGDRLRDPPGATVRRR